MCFIPVCAQRYSGWTLFGRRCSLPITTNHRTITIHCVSVKIGEETSLAREVSSHIWHTIHRYSSQIRIHWCNPFLSYSALLLLFFGCRCSLRLARFFVLLLSIVSTSFNINLVHHEADIFVRMVQTCLFTALLLRLFGCRCSLRLARFVFLLSIWSTSITRHSTELQCQNLFSIYYKTFDLTLVFAYVWIAPVSFFNSATVPHFRMSMLPSAREVLFSPSGRARALLSWIHLSYPKLCWPPWSMLRWGKIIW